MASSTPKSMSSRLMTMKFMQRSAANVMDLEPSTPDGRPAKKVRLSNGASAPGTPGTPLNYEATHSADSKKREESLARTAEKFGETKWVLSFKDPQKGRREPVIQVRQAGFAAIDAGADSEEEEQKPVRMQFGGGVKKKQVKPATLVKAQDSEFESDSSTSSDDFGSDDPTAELIRETKREVAAKERDARKASTNSTEHTPSRPALLMDEDMDLGGLVSLSGGGRNSGGNLSNVECFRCRQKGHRKDQCPISHPPRGSAGRGRGRGRR